MNKPSFNSFQLASLVATTADDKKAKDISLLEIEPVSTLADYFVIVSVDSRAQMTALAETLVETLKDRFVTPYKVDRDKTGHWTVIDFADVVVHILNDSDREYYQLERFWSHARLIPQEEWGVGESERKAS